MAKAKNSGKNKQVPLQLFCYGMNDQLRKKFLSLRLGDEVVLTPNEIIEKTIAVGIAKVRKSIEAKLLLGFTGGAMIALGYLAYIRVSASIGQDLPSIASLIGASVFPIGLIVILMAGGELVTGNMMAVSSAFFKKKISLRELLANWMIITAANVTGAIFAAYTFGHLVGLTSTGIYQQQVVLLAEQKLDSSLFQSFLSGIGCNWFVGIALWLCYGAKDAIGKIVSVWFPVMVFVVIGFQHSVANCFLIPAAIFEGYYSWGIFLQNFIVVFLGNIIGGSIFVAGVYHISLKEK